jgi:hypothetical protein
VSRFLLIPPVEKFSKILRSGDRLKQVVGSFTIHAMIARITGIKWMPKCLIPFGSLGEDCQLLFTAGRRVSWLFG